MSIIPEISHTETANEELKVGQSLPICVIHMCVLWVKDEERNFCSNKDNTLCWISPGLWNGDLPDKSVSMALYFEANYILPDGNATYFGYEEFRGFGVRGLDRKMAYDFLLKKLENAGYPGKRCLLRAICEASNGFLMENGLVGDILHIFLTPSSSESEDLPSEIIRAEYQKNCLEYCDCPLSIFDFSTLS